MTAYFESMSLTLLRFLEVHLDKEKQTMLKKQYAEARS